jgi:TfoX/Sxy family transcriptional regulator of competence genes
MAYDKGLAQRVEEALESFDLSGLAGKKMFGGVGYLLEGNLACGVINDQLIVRVGKDAYGDALKKPGVSLFDIRGGRPMTGWVMVSMEVLDEDDALLSWVRQGVSFAGTLPPK